MMEKKILIFSLSIILLFVLSIFSSGQISDDFTTYSQFSYIEACGCTSITDIITVSNTGSFVSAYTLHIEGKNKDVPALSEFFFVLKPKESKQILNFLDLPCLEQDLEYEIVIESNNGLKKTISQKINIRTCNNNDLKIINGNSFINEPCSMTRFDLEIKNTGFQDEIYHLNIEGFDNSKIDFSENPIILGSGDSRNIYAYLEMLCEDYGTFKGNIISKAENSGVIDKEPIQLIINRNYNYSISFGEYFKIKDEYQAVINHKEPTYNYCSGEINAIPIEVYNEVLIANTYLINEKSKKKWINLEKNQISILGNDKDIFNIIINPTNDIIGNYSFPLNLKSVRGDLILELDINLKIEDCNSLKIDLLDYDQTCCGNSIYPINITNTGTKTNKIKLDNENNTFLSETEIELESGDSKIIYMTIYQPCEEDIKSKIFNLNATIINKNISENKKINLDFVDSKNCHVPYINKNVLKSFYEEKEHKILITNQGIKDSIYNLSLENDNNWIILLDTEIELKSGESKEISLITSPNKSIEQGSYWIHIKAYSNNDYVHYNQIEVRLKNKTIYDQTWIWLNENKGYGILIFLLLILLIFLIIYLIPKKDKSKKEKQKKVNKNKQNKTNKKVSNKNKKDDTFWRKLFLLLFLIILIILLIFGAIWSYNQLSSKFIKEYNESEYNVTDDNNKTYETNKTLEKEIENNESELKSADSKDKKEIKFINNIWNNIKTIFIKEKINESENNLTIEKPFEEQLYEYVLENNLIDSFQYHVFFQNEVYELNLGEMFVDPDGDNLTFSSTTPLNLEVKIEENIAYIKTKENWKGVDYVTFKASDNKGGQALTPEIAFIVREAEKKPLFSTNHLGYLIFIISILVIIILLINTNPSNEE